MYKKKAHAPMFPDAMDDLNPFSSQVPKSKNPPEPPKWKKRLEEGIELFNKAGKNMLPDFQFTPPPPPKLDTQIIIGNPPSKSNCYRIVTIRSKDPLKKGFSSLAGTPELKQYKKDFAIQCNIYRNAGIDVDFNFEMDVYYPSRRSDLDNSLKCILDCLQDVKAITNDNLCQQIIVRRHIDKENPRVEFVITKSNK